MKIKVSPEIMNTNLVPEGDYEAVLDGKMEVVESEAGNPMMRVWNIIQSDADDVHTVGRKVIDQLPVLESTMWKFGQMYKAANGTEVPTNEFDSEREFIEWFFSEVVGKSFKVRIAHRMHKGETRLNVTYLEP